MANGKRIIRTLKKIRNLQKKGIGTDHPERKGFLESVAGELTGYNAIFSDALDPYQDIVIGHSGHQAHCPWISICDGEFDLGERYAYLVDLLFGRFGTLYVVMIPGVYQLSKRDIEARKNFARKALDNSEPDELRINADNICLCVTGGYGIRYEWGIVTAEKINLEKIKDGKLIDRICVQLKLLKKVYNAIKEEQGH